MSANGSIYNTSEQSSNSNESLDVIQRELKDLKREQLALRKKIPKKIKHLRGSEITDKYPRFKNGTIREYNSFKCQATMQALFEHEPNFESYEQFSKGNFSLETQREKFNSLESQSLFLDSLGKVNRAKVAYKNQLYVDKWGPKLRNRRERKHYNKMKKLLKKKDKGKPETASTVKKTNLKDLRNRYHGRRRDKMSQNFFSADCRSSGFSKLEDFGERTLEKITGIREGKEKNDGEKTVKKMSRLEKILRQKDNKGNFVRSRAKSGIKKIQFEERSDSCGIRQRVQTFNLKRPQTEVQKNFQRKKSQKTISRLKEKKANEKIIRILSRRYGKRGNINLNVRRNFELKKTAKVKGLGMLRRGNTGMWSTPFLEKKRSTMSKASHDAKKKEMDFIKGKMKRLENRLKPNSETFEVFALGHGQRPEYSGLSEIHLKMKSDAKARKLMSSIGGRSRNVMSSVDLWSKEYFLGVMEEGGYMKQKRYVENYRDWDKRLKLCKKF
jgi:hypothetical protein